jgi:hypothetical protein
MKIPTGPFLSVIDKDGEYLGDMSPSPDVVHYLSEHQSILLAHLKVMNHIFTTGTPYPIPEKK